MAPSLFRTLFKSAKSNVDIEKSIDNSDNTSLSSHAPLLKRSLTTSEKQEAVKPHHDFWRHKALTGDEFLELTANFRAQDYDLPDQKDFSLGLFHLYSTKFEVGLSCHDISDLHLRVNVLGGYVQEPFPRFDLEIYVYELSEYGPREVSQCSRVRA